MRIKNHFVRDWKFCQLAPHLFLSSYFLPKLAEFFQFQEIETNSSTNGNVLRSGVKPSLGMSRVWSQQLLDIFTFS